MHNAIRWTSVLAAALMAAALTGCPSVDPGPLEPPLAEPEPGPLLTLHAYYEGESKEESTETLARLRDTFDRFQVYAYRIAVDEAHLSVSKAILNGEGLLRDLEMNRFFSTFLRAGAEDRYVTFFRGDDLQDSRALRSIARKSLLGGGRMEFDLTNQAFSIYAEVTPELYTFKKAALRIPLRKDMLGYQPEASRMTLTVRDPDVIKQLRAKVGWDAAADPTEMTDEQFVEQVNVERQLFVAVAGIILIADVIRPGAQLIEDDSGIRWEFGGFVKESERVWAEALAARKDGRTMTRWVFEMKAPTPR